MLQVRPAPHTCAQQAVLVVEGVDPGTVAYERGRLEGLLVTQLCHTQLGLQVDTLPVRRLLNGLINLPAQLPTHTLPYLRAGVDHLKVKWRDHLTVHTPNVETAWEWCWTQLKLTVFQHTWGKSRWKRQLAIGFTGTTGPLRQSVFTSAVLSVFSIQTKYKLQTASLSNTNPLLLCCDAFTPNLVFYSIVFFNWSS